MRRFGGRWSKSKLDCVESYTRRYLDVMQKQRFTLHYVDAFAGSGRQEVGRTGSSDGGYITQPLFTSEADRIDAEEFLEGSALRALDASLSAVRPFDHFLLIDVHEFSCGNLQSLVSQEYPDLEKRVEVLCEDANSALRRYVSSIDWTSTRALVFLDPYGLEVQWDTLEHLARSGGCDVWYLFPLGGVTRMMRKDGQIPQPWKERLDTVFGHADWYRELYARRQEATLFDDEGDFTREASTREVIEYVRQRLQSIFPAVSDAAVLRNRKGSPLFVLVLGVSNPGGRAQGAALRIANHLIRDLHEP